MGYFIDKRDINQVYKLEHLQSLANGYNYRQSSAYAAACVKTFKAKERSIYYKKVCLNCGKILSGRQTRCHVCHHNKFTQISYVCHIDKILFKQAEELSFEEKVTNKLEHEQFYEYVKTHTTTKWNRQETYLKVLPWLLKGYNLTQIGKQVGLFDSSVKYIFVRLQVLYKRFSAVYPQPANEKTRGGNRRSL